MNITTPVERQAKGAVPTCIPRAIFRPSARKTTEIYSTARERLRGYINSQPRSRSRAVLCRRVIPTKIQGNNNWEILDEPHPQACGDRARGRRDLDGSSIRRLRIRAEDKTESHAVGSRARVRIEAAGDELHIGLPSTAHSPLRSQLNDRQCDDGAPGAFIADLDARLVPGARIRAPRAGLQRRRRAGA